MNQARRVRGMTLLEMLIALVILSVVLLITTTTIVMGLRVNRVQEDATSSQAKLRRIVEVQTQELRGAVMGAISDYPVTSGPRAVSFGLLAGDGGLEVEDRPGVSWGTANNTFVYSSDPSVLDDFVGGPALMVNGNGESLLIPMITGAPAADRLNHNGCKISIPYTQNTRLFRVSALGMRYDPDDRTLYQVELAPDTGEIVEIPVAFDLTDTSFRYEYQSPSSVQILDSPRRDASGRPQIEYDDGGETYELARLQLVLATEAGEGRGVREYVSYVEMRGLGNDDRVTAPALCEGGGTGSGGSGGGDDDPGGAGGDDDTGGGGGDTGDGDDDTGGGGGGDTGGGDDDDDEPSGKPWF